MPDKPTLPSPNRIQLRVRTVVAEQLGHPVDRISPEATFLDLGADSLLLVGITRQLDRDLGVRVPMRELFSEADTPGKLAELITRRLPSGTAEATDPTTEPAPSPRDESPAPPVPASPPGPTAPAEFRPTPVPPPPTAADPIEAQATGEPVAGLATAQTRLLADMARLVADRTAAADPAIAAAQVGLLGQVAGLVAETLTAAPPPPHRGDPGSVSAATESGSAAPAERTTAAVSAATAEPPPATPPRTEPAPLSTVDVGSIPAVSNRSGTADFSVYFFGDYPHESTTGTDKYDFIVEASRFADRNGFHAVWLPERHFHSFGGLFPNPSLLAAALARETDRVRLHAGSVVLPLHQTIRVAEEWSVVDNLSNGRAGICVASGWHANDFALFPQRYGTHRDSMYTQLTQLRDLWRGEAIPAVSGTGDDIEVKLYPTPVQAMPPMYAAVVGNPESYRLAARNGLGIVTNLMTQSIEQLAERVDLYRRTRAEAGLDPDTGRVVVLLHTFLGEDLATVRQQAFEPFCDYMRSSLGLLGQAANSLGMSIDVHNTPEDDLRFMLARAYDRYCESRALIGTVDSCGPIVDDLIGSGVNEIAAFVDFGIAADLAGTGLPHLDRLRQRHADTPDRPVAANDRVNPDRDTAPLSFAQERFWLAEQLFPEHNTYNEVRAVRLRGAIDRQALRTAFSRLADRHSTLRTVIRQIDGEPRQVVDPGQTVELPISDHTGQDEDDVVARVMAAESGHRFALADGPLFRPRLLRFAADHHVLFLNAHHAIIDTVSAYHIATEISALYRAEVSDTPLRLPELPTDYFDYARTQRQSVDSPQWRSDLDYWTGRLAGDLPVLALPTDRPRPAVLNPVGASVVDHLPAELSRRVREFSSQSRSTMFMTLLTGLAATLRRVTGQPEVVIGAAITDRPDGTENLIGAMLNTIPLRIRQTGESFAELLSAVRDITMDGYQHSGVPFELIVDAVKPPRDTSRTPLFQTLVVFENEDVFDLDLPGVEATLLDAVPDRAIYDLALYLANPPEGVRVHAEYNTELFDEDTIRRYLRQFESLLDAAIGEPDRPLTTLADLPDGERLRLNRWQSGPEPQSPITTLPEPVAARAAEAPTATAVEDGDSTVTYAQLDRAATELAERLSVAGDRPVVGIRLPRGAALVTAQLAVLRHGGICLPLDPSLPIDRVRFMLADTGCRLVLTDEDIDVPDVALWHLDAAGRPSGDFGPVPVGATSPDPGTDTAYLFYTSGSTGTPKGVPVGHRAIGNACTWYRQRTGLTAGTRTTITAGPGFDVFTMELWSALAAGARLVIPTEEARHDPATMVRWLTEQRIEVAWLPTVLAESVLVRPESDDLTTRVIVTAGSALRVAPRQTAPFELVNAYGPTETGVVASHATVPPGASAIPIGVPLPGVALLLLDEHLRQVPIGTTAEIHIGGVGVATGYLGRPDLTEQRFVVTGSGDRLYRTGDLARWNRDGQLEFLGRDDDQVQIRGFRVEPGEVAAALRGMDEVGDAFVVAESDPPQLAAHVVCERPVDTPELLRRLKRILPDHMVPRRFSFPPELPLDPNGKVDRSRLPAAAVVPVADGVPPGTVREKQVGELWSAELGITITDVTTSFFDLGGDSLAAARLVSRARAITGTDYPLLDFFRSPTVRAMAARLSDFAEPAPGTAGAKRVRGVL